MFEFGFNSDATALGLDVGFSFGARHERRTPKIDLGGSSVAVVHSLHGSRHADIYHRCRLRIPCTFALLRNRERDMRRKQAQGRSEKDFVHTSSILSKINRVSTLPGL